ncbi:MAG: YihY/virulence factor BrkB family protein [Oscillospiraceae bacterium]|nr:YihY/virulence factor BrkB family protein [Oscillospiraceae bacterium]
MKDRRMMNRFIAFYNFIYGTTRIELGAFAASAAFFLFLSLIPILLLLCSIIPYTGITQADLIELVHESVGQIAPGAVTDFVDGVVKTIFAGGAVSLSLSALVTLWIASKAFLALTRGMDAIHNDGRQNYFIARIKSCFYTLIMIVVMAFMLVGVIFGKKLVSFIGGYFPAIIQPLYWLLSQRFWMAWIILTCVFTAIYTWVPKKKLRLRDQIPGAIFSAASWIIFSALFSAYLNHSSSFGIYGSLATIVIALIWMYYCMYILLLGTYLNVKRTD